MKYKNREIYDGDWKDDKKEGNGTFIFKNNKDDILGIPEKKYVGDNRRTSFTTFFAKEWQNAVSW